MVRYTFIEHPLSYLIANISNYIPGATDVVVGYCNNNKELLLKELKNGNISRINLRNRTHLLQKFRKEKSTSSWIRTDMISFLDQEKEKRVIKQMSLEDEDDNNILCLKFLSPFDRLFDFVLIKVNHAGIFGLSKNSKINTEQKATIGNILYHTISARIREEYNNLETHQLVLNNLQNQKIALENYKQENEQLKENYKKSLMHFIQSLITRLNQEHDFAIALSDDAKEFIISKTANLELIEKSIRGAIHMAMNLSLNLSSTILIEQEHILIEEQKQSEASIYKKDKYSNVIEILDKYEAAAEKAHQREWKINGNTVADLCEPKITPSAITFNLKKYKKAINILLERYDNKWPLIRTYFKPLRNIIDSSQNSLNEYKSA